MVTFEISLIAIVLTVFTTFHYGSADGICVDLIAEEPWFKRGTENRYINFQNAYKHLSIEQFNIKFSIQPHDTDQIKSKKILQKNLIIGYFNDILMAKRLSLYKMEFPLQWCIKQVKRAFGDSLYDNDAVDDQMQKCAEYTVGYLFKNTSIHKIERIFTILYAHWTEEILLNEINKHRNTELTLSINMTPLYIEHYSLAYFRYFAEYVDQRNREGKCKSIEKYCAVEALCIELIAKEPMFKTGADNWCLNFQNAYKHLSIDILNDKFQIQPGDSDEKKYKIDQQKRLTIGYFNDIMMTKRISLFKMNFPRSWCMKQVQKIFGNSISSSDAANTHLQKCAEFTIGYLFDNEEILDMEKLFTVLYKHWTEDQLLSDIDAQRKTNLSLSINMTALYIEHYSLGYFRYFEEYVSKRNHEAKCKSIERYCALEDYKLMPINVD